MNNLLSTSQSQRFFHFSIYTTSLCWYRYMNRLHIKTELIRLWHIVNVDQKQQRSWNWPLWYPTRNLSKVIKFVFTTFFRVICFFVFFFGYIVNSLRFNCSKRAMNTMKKLYLLMISTSGQLYCDLIQVFLLLTLSRFSSVFVIDFGKVNTFWDAYINDDTSEMKYWVAHWKCMRQWKRNDLIL